MMEPAPTLPPPKRKVRRLLLWTGASLAVLLLAVLIGAPPLIAATIRTQFIAAVEKNLEATATVGGASFSWTGRVSVDDVAIKDRSGASLVTFKSAVAEVGVLAALEGRYVADFKLDSPRLELRRGADGRLNVAGMTKPTAPDAPKPKNTSPMSIPDFEARLHLKDAVIVVAGATETAEFPLTGTFVLKSTGGVLALTGTNTMNDGSLSMTGAVDLRDAAPAAKPESATDVEMQRVPLDARMGPILELMHPAFAVAAGQLDGVVDASLSVKYQGSVLSPAEDFLKKLSGRGRLEIRHCTFSGSRFLGDLLKALALDKREIRMKPVEFRIVDGRIHYEQPWQWTISGSDTTFTGSIGFDRTLDLVWNVPVTDELAARVPGLKSLRGKTYHASIKGTVSHPRLDWKGLVAQAAEDKIERVAKRGLEDLVVGRDEKKAKKLLEEADGLHQGGKRAEAAAKYRKIKDEHRGTRVYKDNKDRIEPRSEEK